MFEVEIKNRSTGSRQAVDIAILFFLSLDLLFLIRCSILKHSNRWALPALLL